MGTKVNSVMVIGVEGGIGKPSSIFTWLSGFI